MTIWQSIQSAFIDSISFSVSNSDLKKKDHNSSDRNNSDRNNSDRNSYDHKGSDRKRSDRSNRITELANDSDAVKVNLEKLIQLRFHSSHIALNSQRKAFSSLSGNYNSTFKGRGLNFDEVRPYQPGDDIRNIDWNVTARTDRVHTKVFKEERERPVYVIVDLSSSMYFGTRHCLKSVTAAKAAALFSWAGADHANRIGGFIFNDSRHIELRPRGGYHGVLRFLKQLTDFHNNQHNNNNYNQQHNAPHNDQVQVDMLSSAQRSKVKQQLFARLRRVIHPGSIVLFASDFNHIGKDEFRHLQYIAKHNDLISVHIYDALEKDLPPPGRYGISNGEKHLTLDTQNTSLRTSFQQHFIDKSRAIEEFCLLNQVNLINLATNDNVENCFLTSLGKDVAIRRVARSRH
jgi:hypothetical protein